MANFVRYTATAGTSFTVLNSGGPTNSAIVIGLVAANSSTTTADTIDVRVGTTHYLVFSAPVPVGSTLSVLDGKVVLNAGDEIAVRSGNGTVDVSLSILEL